MTADAVVRVCVVGGGSAALDAEAMLGSAAAIHDAGPSARAVLIEHPGPNFCFGGNVGLFAGADSMSEFVGEAARQFHGFVRAMADSPLPVVAGVSGWAAGAGMSIVCAADIVIAGESARFRAAYPGLGFTPDGGMTWTLPRAVGRARALDILLSNRVLDAEEAFTIGLVSRVVPDDDVQAAAAEAAEAFASASPGALAGVKRLVTDGEHRSLDEQLDAEAASIAARADTPDGREGVTAFVERRKPQFPG